MIWDKRAILGINYTRIPDIINHIALRMNGDIKINSISANIEINVILIADILNLPSHFSII
jgi:hypothetical protein